MFSVHFLKRKRVYCASAGSYYSNYKKQKKTKNMYIKLTDRKKEISAIWYFFLTAGNSSYIKSAIVYNDWRFVIEI